MFEKLLINPPRRRDYQLNATGQIADLAHGENRLGAFRAGVLAIIITNMVLGLKVPHGAQLAALKPLPPIFSRYVLGFTYL
jgi:uncharacterized membrane protein